MMDERVNNMREGAQEAEGKLNLYALFFKYLAYWPWFAAGVCVCCLGMLLFIFYTAPVYKITSSVLIKVTDQNNSPMNGMMNAMGQDLGMFSMTNNFENEIAILQSRTLIRKVVCDLNLYTNVEEERLWGYNTPLYKNTPIQVYMTPQEADHLGSAIELRLEYEKNGRLTVEAEYSYMDKYGKEIEVEDTKKFDSLPAIYPTEVGVISFMRNDSVEILSEDGNIRLAAYIEAPTEVANDYLDNLTLKPASKTTTIAQLSLKNNLKERGEDFINHLIKYYNQDANDEKNEVAQKSAEFIEERIGIINQELSSTETQLVDFKQRSGLTNLTNDTQIALQESSKYEQQRMANATQIRLVQFLKNYINDPANANEIVPANVGLEDVELGSVIDRYNDMLIERKRLLRTSSENNPAVINLNAGIEAMFQNVKTAVNNVLKGLQITQADLERQTRKFESRISQVPQDEKEFLTISRQQEIKASLYTMLLQKREENAITLASTATNGRIIEDVLADRKPVFPRRLLFMAGAFILGLLIPAGLVYLREFFQYKIESSEDVKEITDVPVVGEIPLEKEKRSGGIVLKENRNNIMEECFRGLRTNLLFMLEPKDQVILVTSTMPGEGKSFIAGNLAVSLAFLGKKVLIVGLDIRKPGLNKIFNLSHSSQGITNYLGDPEQVSLFDLIQPSAVSDRLDILVGGTIPPNPTELVARNTLDGAINQLKERYDYIVLDTAPIAMVADTALIARVADLGIYVCRMDVTPKESLSYINQLYTNHKFTKIACAINGIDMSKRKHSYGYTYGKKYGYGKGGTYRYGY